MPNTIPAYTIGGITRPALILDNAGNIILTPEAAAFAAAYGTKALYFGCPVDTPYPPVAPTLSAPVDASAGVNSVLENAAVGTQVGITAQASNPGGLPVTYSLSDSNGGRFQIDATTGVVTVAAALDFETAPGQAYNITVQATDGILTTSQSFTIGVVNVNEAPAGTDNTITASEDTSRVFTAADFGFTDPSDSSAPNALAAVRITTLPAAGTLLNNGVPVVAGDSISAASIAAGHLVYIAAANASGAAYASFTFQIRDNGGTANGGVDTDQSPNTITINVNAVNDAPTATNLTQSLVIDEDAAATTLFTVPPVAADIDSATVTARLTVNASAGVLVGAGAGVLSAGVLTYSITGTPAAVNTALAAVQFDSADNFNGTTSVGVTIDDGANGPQGTNPAGTVSITVNAVNDAPNATNLTQALVLDEDAAATSLFTAAPVVTDDSATVTATLTVANPAAGALTGGGFSATANPGEYTFSGSPAQVTAALAAVQFDSAPDFNGATTVAVAIGDGQAGPQNLPDPTGTITITVNAVNDAPTATNLTQALIIGEDDAATTLFTLAPVVSDIDSATVTATLTLDAAAGVLTGAGAGVLNAGVLTYTITGTPAAVTTALAGVAFDSAPDFNGITDVGITIDDGANGPQGSNPIGSGTVTINAVNDAPTATNLTQSLSVGEDGAPATLFTLAPVVADIDSSNVTATLTLDAAAGVLNGAGAGVLNAGVLTYTITGTAATVNAALATVTYDSADNFNGPTSVGVTIDDGANGPQGPNPTGTVSITVNAVNDAPTATNLNQSLAINEDAAATTLFTLPPVTADIDSANVTATLTLDAAAGVLNGAGAGVLNAGVLTYTITGAPAAVNAALAAVTYDSAPDFFGTPNVGVTIDDGANGPQGSNPSGSIGITVNPVNDAPTVAATANNPSYVPGADLFSGVTASTVESGQVITQLVLTVSNVLGNDESLVIDGDTVSLLDGTVSGAPTATLGVSYSVAVSGNTATITITSPGLTGAQSGTLIDALSYTNATVDPGELPRVVTIVSLTDDGGIALGGVATGTPNLSSTVFFNAPPTANDDAAAATEAGGLNNSVAGTDPSGNVITASGPGDVADTDPDAGDSVTVVAAGTGPESAPTGAGTVNTAFNGLYGSLLINTDGSYTYTVNQSNAAVQGLRLPTDTLTDSFNYTIQDTAGAQDIATLTFTINGANDSPVAVADTPTAVEAGGAANGTAGTDPGGNVLTNDTDVDSAGNGETKTVQGVAAGTQAGPLTLNVGTGVASANGYGTLTIAADGTYSYVVDNTNAAVQALRTSGQTLTDTFSYTMHDQAGVTSTTQVTITIEGANDNPTAANDTASATENGGVNNAIAGTDPTGNLLTNDTDPDGNGEIKTVQGVESGNNPGNVVTTGVGSQILGSYGRLTVQADGSYIYEVDQALTNSLLPSDHPTDIFTYTMHDAAGVTSTAILTVTVNGANDLPQAVADAGSITEDAAPTLFAVVVNNDVLDPDAGALNTIAITGTVTASSAGNPLITNGDATAIVSGTQIQVTLGADFQTLALGETATVTVPYTLTGNSPGDTSSSNLTVTVTGVNDGVVANDDSGGSITEDAGTTTYNVHGNDTLDVDHTATNFITIDTVTATDAGGDGITGADVSASVVANQIEFTLGSDFQKLGGGESSTITIAYTLHGDQPGDVDSATLTYTVTGVNDAPVAQDFTFNAANSAIGNTSLVLDNGSGTAPVDPAGPQKTISGSLLSGATDVDTAAGSLTVTAETVSNAAGSITYTANGDFTFMPTAGFTGNAVFNYTLNDNDGSGNATDIGQITINVATPKVWYVDASAAAGGDGSSDNPFNSLAELNGGTGDGTTNDDVDGANDIIFVYGGTYTGGIVLEDGQTLISQSQGLTVNGTALLGATGSNAVINGAVVLASNNTIDGIDFGNSGSSSVYALSGSNVGNAVVTDSSINNTSGGAVNINGSGTGMNMQFTSVSSTNASTSAILLQEARGTFNATSGTLNNGATTAADIRLIGNNSNDDVAFSFGGSINDDQGQLVQITGQTGGTKLFSGAITDGNDGDGGGIDLSANTGATINFTGGVTLSTGGNAAFSATGGGTVNVTGSNNHITTTTGTALNISNTTIGASNVTFRDISANGGANGIILDTTGSSGGLRVTGNGTTVGASGGGVIQNMTGGDGAVAGNGIYLNNTFDVELNGLQLNNFDNSAIRGFSVTGFTLTNSTISGTSGTNSGATEGAITFGTSNPGGANGLLGTGSQASLIDNVDVSGAIEHTIEVYNQSGSFGLTISNSNIHDNSVASGSDGILMEMQGTATATVNITGNNFSNNKSQAIQVAANDSSSVNLTITDNIITRGTQGNEGIVLSNGSNGDLTALVDGNTISGFGGVSIFVGQTAGNATAASLLQATISDNIITTPTTASNSAILAFLTSTVGQVSEARILIDNNTITQNSTQGVARGIFVDTPDANTTPNYDVTVSNNTVHIMDNVAGVNGIAVQARRGTMDASIFGNHVDFPNGTPAGVVGIRERQANTDNAATAPTATIQRNGSASGTAAGVLADNNPGNTVEILGTVTIAPNGTVQLPGTPPLPLFAAPGGVASSTGSPGVTNLTQTQLDSVVSAAIAKWADAGASAAQLAVLSSIVFTVDDLAGTAIGEQTRGHIAIDTDAAGYGWFVDSTPWDNFEFVHAANAAGTDLFTVPSNAAAGHIDLLTVVVHEMGHELGLTHSDEAGDIMAGMLAVGERRLPDAADVALTNAAQPQASLQPAITIASGGSIGGRAGADNFVFADIDIPGSTPAPLTLPANYDIAGANSFDFSALTSQVDHSTMLGWQFGGHDAIHLAHLHVGLLA
ncbi:MAG: tandem-95 repeat protein [Pseudomonadota bacterium]